MYVHVRYTVTAVVYVCVCVCVCVCVASWCGMLSKRQWLNRSMFWSQVYLSIDTAVCFLNCCLLLSLSHIHTHTHTHVLYFSLICHTFYHIPICFAKSRWFSHFCLHALPMESNFCIHNSGAQWGPCNEFYLATMFMFS